MIRPWLLKYLCVKEQKQIAMNKRIYEAPVTERFQVELEGVFCSSVVINQVQIGSGEVGAEGHDVNNTGSPDNWGDFNDNFKAEGWL